MKPETRAVLEANPTFTAWERHRALDQLWARYLLAHPDAEAGSITVVQLVEWSWLKLDTRETLRCGWHISQGLFESCQHWELTTGETLELRARPSYCSQEWDLVLWEPPLRQKKPGIRLAESFAADLLVDCVAMVREHLQPGHPDGPHWPIAATVLVELNALFEKGLMHAKETSSSRE